MVNTLIKNKLDTSNINKYTTPLYIVGGSIVAYFLYKKYKEWREGADQRTQIDLVQKDINAQIKTQTPSFTDAYYQQQANTIKTLLNGCETPDSELKVVSIIVATVKIKLDWDKLVKAFGTQTIDNCVYGSTQYTLPQLLNDQLDSNFNYYYINENNVKPGIPKYSVSGWFTESINVLNAFLNTRIGLTV